MDTKQNYFIKESYISNTRLLTREVESGEYWTPTRLKNSARFQYHVYERCRELILSRNLKSVMEVGCGPATKVRELIAPICDDITLLDQPTLEEVVRGVLPRASFHGVDLEVPGLALGRKFDLIICSDVIEHLMNPNACLQFIKRHMVPGGLAVISTPERDYLRGPDCRYSPKPEHVREWNRIELGQYLENMGYILREHLFYPQVRLKKPEFLLSRLLNGLVKSAQWSACQLAVVESAAEDL